MKEIAKIIEYLSDEQITELLQLILNRFGTLHPDTQFVVLTLPKDDIYQRQQIIDSLCTLLQTSPCA